jgi:hypothetical protein
VKRTPAKRRLTLAAIAAGLALPTAAYAEPSKEDVAKADTLFREAQILVQKGQLAEGCPKFAESQRLDPANGTLLNLALCHEKEGKLGTAHRELQELLSITSGSKSPDDRERTRVANDRLKALEKKVTRLVLDVSALPKDATITLDGEKLGDPTTPVVVDPGLHTVEVTAPQKKPGKKNVDAKEPGTLALKLDPLEDDAPPPPMPTATPPKTEEPRPETHFWTGQRVAGALIAGIGIAGVGVGAVFGLDTFAKRDARDAHCEGTVCDAQGMELHDQARSSAMLSSIAFGVGGAALTIGAIVFFTASSSSTSAAPASGRAAPLSVGLGPTGIVLRGSM